jgi:hypothetical protein
VHSLKIPNKSIKKFQKIFQNIQLQRFGLFDVDGDSTHRAVVWGFLFTIKKSWLWHGTKANKKYLHNNFQLGLLDTKWPFCVQKSQLGRTAVR